MSGTMRLDRLLANMGYGSRREVHALVDAGLVTLDGIALEDAERRLATTADLTTRMQVQNNPLDPLPGTLVLMLNKPLGMTCSHKDHGTLVYSVLPPRWRLREPAISTIGRLDKETTGLLLLTDDGALLHRVISPRNHVEKRYLATLDRPLSGEEGAIFASGTLMLEGEEKPLTPAKLEVIDATHAYLTVTEGRYHQVRRMFAAVGNHVVALHRDRVGALALPESLESGQYRVLDATQIAALVPGAPR